MADVDQVPETGVRPPRRKSIRTKVALVVFAAVTVGFLTISALGFLSESARTEETSMATHRQLTSLLAAQMSGAVRFKKPEIIEAATGDLQSDEQAHAVHFVTLDATGGVLVEKGESPESAVALDIAKQALADNDFRHVTSGDYHVSASPVRFGDKNDAIGSVAVTWDNRERYAALRMLFGRDVGEALVLALLVAVLIDFAMRRWMSRPIAAVIGTMSRLAAGDTDLTIEGTSRRDEIGDMARAVQVFRDSEVERRRLASVGEREQAERLERQQRVEALIASFREDIRNRLASIGTNMEQMQATAFALIGIADSAAGGASGAASASDQASANVQAVAGASEELAASINEIARQVSDTNVVVAKATEGTRTTNEKIAGLSVAAQKIGEVVKLISDIAAQTNLLALNATIESARAGEHGKGFAVVAAEVKTLANQTAKATDEIGAQIAAIQNSTGDAVSAIAEITGTMDEVSRFTSAIAEAVTQQGLATAEISRNVAEAAGGTSDAAARIGGVTAVAAETSQAASKVEATSGDVAGQTKELRGVVDRFLTDVA